MSLWFRYYSEALEDPKVQRLPDAMFKTWVNLLCLATRNEGLLPKLEDIGFALRLSAKETQRRLDFLASAGLIDNDGETLFPHNWNGRQFKSDDSYERVKRFRDRYKNRSSNGDDNAPVTLQETEPDTDTEPDKGTVAIKPDLTAAVEAWNLMASEKNLPKIQRLTEPRKRHLIARLAECGGMDGWNAAMAKVGESPFLTGENKSNWRADFDFVLQQSSFTKLLEGKYDGQAASKRSGSLEHNIGLVSGAIDQELARARAAQGGERGGEPGVQELPGFREVKS